MITPIPDERRDERSDAEHELLQRGEPPANAWVCNLRLVQRREHREHADTHSGQETPAIHVVDVLCAGLDTTSEEKNDASGEDSQAPTHPVGERSNVYVPIVPLVIRNCEGARRQHTMRMLPEGDSLR